MATKRIHFPQTTAQQRELLFETWEATGNVTEACRKAHVGRGTFYYWKSRFDEHGYKIQNPYFLRNVLSIAPMKE